MIAGFGGTIIDGAHGEFDTKRFGWNGMIDRKPALLARCPRVADSGLQADARCGGHSVSGASLPENGLLIDLAGLKDIAVHPDARLARVGGGALLDKVDAAKQALALRVTAGVEPDPGVGGFDAGAGSASSLAS